MNLEGVWVHEFAELAGLRASDMDVLKAFMSRATDRYRMPYGRNTEDHQRRVVFAGTVNEGGYLSDPTGARRFWPLEMAQGSRVDLDWIAEHRDQLWAEADALFKSSIGHVLPEPLWSMAAERQADETVDDPWVDKLAVMLSNRHTERQAFETGTGDYATETIDGERVASFTTSISHHTGPHQSPRPPSVAPIISNTGGVSAAVPGTGASSHHAQETHTSTKIKKKEASMADPTMENISLNGSIKWAAARIGWSLNRFRQRRELLASDGFPKVDRITNLYVKADVDAWINRRRQLSDQIAAVSSQKPKTKVNLNAI